MTIKRIIILSLLLIAFLVVGGYTLAQTNGGEATLLITSGQVNVLQPQTFLFFNNTRKTSLMSGEILTVRQGDTVEVTPASAAVLTMGDGTSAELFADTIVQVSELVSEETNFRVRLTLLGGKTVHRVQRLLKADDMYDVQTPSSTASVRGTVFIVEVYSNQESFYSVDEGVVAVQMAEQEVLVEAGFEVTAVSGQPLQLQPMSPVSNQTFTESETAVGRQPTAQPASVVAPEEVNTTRDAVESGTQNEEANEVIAPSDPAKASNQNPPGDGNTETTSPEQTAVSPNLPVATETVTNSGPAQPTLPAAQTSAPSGSTAVPPTATRILPTATRVLPTNTIMPPTATLAPPTNTLVPPTATPVPPTNTPIPIPPPTNTPVPPPTDTPVPPPTATPEAEPKVTLCHSGNTIEVDQSAVQAHLDHGDTLGSCP